MKTLSVFEAAERQIDKLDPANKEYILTHPEFLERYDQIQWAEDRQDGEYARRLLVKMQEFIVSFTDRYMTPANVKVGDGVTVQLYSDAHAYTVVKVTKTSVTIQRDKAIKDPNFKPEIVPGGFAGHCTNQDKQTYTYERDENGQLETFRYSKKWGRFQQPKAGRYLTPGRHEFYDYNF